VADAVRAVSQPVHIAILRGTGERLGDLRESANSPSGEPPAVQVRDLSSARQFSLSAADECIAQCPRFHCAAGGTSGYGVSRRLGVCRRESGGRGEQ